MKIGYIVEPRKVIGGGVRAAMNLAKAMKNYYGEECTIFGTYRDAVADENIRFAEVDSLRPMSVRYIGNLHRFIRTFSPDIVHCLGLYTALICIIYRSVTNRKFKIVCTVHRVTMNLRFRPLIKLVIRHIARNVDYTTFLTNYQKEHYFKNIGFRPGRFIVIPNVIYIQAVTDTEKNSMRTELAAKLQADYLTSYVGRIIPSKNLEDFIRLIAILNRRGVNMGGVLVGGYEQTYYDRLQEIIHREQITNKIIFIGYVNTPSLYTASSDTTTTTTLGEALPNLLIESFAHGKITFSSDIPQMVDLIEDGVNGVTSSLADLERFADKMERVCRDPALKNRMEKSARETYERIYDPQRVASEYHHVYINL